MKIEHITIDLKVDEYLSNINKFKNGTPSDYIIFKKICGIGATHGELKYRLRNSIIIEPNTPVIDCKKDAKDGIGNKEFPNLFTVYKGVSKENVIAYLKSNISPKKIMCTPEAYTDKVKPAILESEFNLYRDFFMLLDESDRITKDVDFRNSIVIPVKDFFKFKSKAMVSATALIPSDPRFEANGFKILEVSALEREEQHINLIQTNNILFTIKEYLEEHTGKPIYIFINSPDLIHILIKRLKIESRAKVFCAEKSARRLRKNGFDNVSTQLGEFAEINFLTSRYYSAVDIELEVKPNVIMVTDVLRKSFTMLHPFTDVIQIIGRFRKGLESVTHISNFDSELNFKQEQDAIEFINDSYKCFTEINIKELIEQL